MADPLALSALADLLPIRSVRWTIRRLDELSGSGDGRYWQASHADPLWTAEVSLDRIRHNAAKRIAAIIRKRHGSQDTFFLYDPLSRYPQADPDGSILGAATVQVHSIGLNNQSLRLKGLPAGYDLSLGDKGQITVATDRNFFFEFSQDVSAAGTGITPQFEIFPHCPPGLAVDDPVMLIRPACKVFIVPDSHDPGTAEHALTRGGQFTVMERRR